VTGRQYLVIDADDTLWEGNIHFERAFDEFCEFLNHSAMTRQQVRAALDEIEMVNNKIHGYGSDNFARNMVECYHRLTERSIVKEDIDRIMALAENIRRQPLEIIEGVEVTLEYLCSRHDLTLFTKGHPEEQKLKIDRSGLGVYFGHTAIVKEKDAASYRQLVEERGLEPARTWMIGNSPKSDINPALAAGIGAVYIPHKHTWHLEHEEVRDGAGRLVVLERFSDLRQHF
jgi:putative hydrolase of the HAD superfamily